MYQGTNRSGQRPGQAEDYHNQEKITAERTKKQFVSDVIYVTDGMMQDDMKKRVDRQNLNTDGLTD